MDIQDLGAIGEFVSSIVIGVTLIFLVYEVQTTKRATVEANGHERHRARDLAYQTQIESPLLGQIMVKAMAHLTPPGASTGLEANAREFGLEPNEMFHLNQFYMRQMAQSADWVVSDLPARDHEILTRLIRTNLKNPLFSKWYELWRRVLERPDSGGPVSDELFALIEKLRTS